MQEVNSTYSTDGCQSNLSGESLMQDAVCDVAPHSLTTIEYAGQNSVRSALVWWKGGDCDRLCNGRNRCLVNIYNKKRTESIDRSKCVAERVSPGCAIKNKKFDAWSMIYKSTPENAAIKIYLREWNIAKVEV